MNQDEEHLRLLSIFHRVLGGLFILMGFFPIIHLVVGILILSGRLDEIPDRQFVGMMFIILSAFFMILFWVLGIILLLSGKYIKRRIHHNFCFVVSAIICLFVPLGTALGVSTIIVLSRVSVKEMFNASPSF